MDSFEFNKLAGALLSAVLFVVALGLFADMVFWQPAPAKAGYELPTGKASKGKHAATAKAAPAVPLAVLLAKADVSKGKAAARVCEACHNLAKGGGIKIGPPLWGVVGRPKGSVPGFSYSSGMKAKGGKWTFADLNIWLTDPAAYVPGTKMTFSGVKNAQRRADIIAYLRTLSDHPLPLPKPPATKTAPKGKTPPAKK